MRYCTASVVLPDPGTPSMRYRRLGVRPPQRMSSRPAMPVADDSAYDAGLLVLDSSFTLSLSRDLRRSHAVKFFQDERYRTHASGSTSQWTRGGTNSSGKRSSCDGVFIDGTMDWVGRGRRAVFHHVGPGVE